MSDPVDPVGGPKRPERRQRNQRRAVERRGDLSKLPALVDAPSPRQDEPEFKPREPSPRAGASQPSATTDAAFAAQLLAGAPKRGLKGGPETLDRARSSYLGAEFSGSNDRRPPKGRITKTDI